MSKKYNKPKNWDGKGLQGDWEFTIKKDGVRVFIKDGVALSRADKPLYNLEGLEDGDYEVFIDDWNTTVSRVRTQNGEPVTQDQLYLLDPPNKGLIIGTLRNPTAKTIKFWLDAVVDDMGDEGLVLRQGNRWIKVKPTETYDVKVTGIQAGKGKFEGMLGSFVTDKGKVGVFRDITTEQRKELLDVPIGAMIEVECMGLTKNGKFRHPVYLRHRFDKDE